MKLYAPTYIMSTLILTVAWSCTEITTAEDQGIDTTDVTIIKMNPDSVLEQRNFILSSKAFDSVKYIPLETKKECLIGTITQMEVFKGKKIILDETTKSIFIFDENGKFLKKIKKIDSHIFTIDRTNEQILVQNNSIPNSIERYTFEGELIKTQTGTVSFSNFEHLGKNILAIDRNNDFYYDRQANEKFTSFNLMVAEDNEVKFQYFNMDTASVNFHDFYKTPKSFYRSEDTVFFIRCYDTNIYEINDRMVKKRFSFDFPNKSRLPEDFLTSRKYKLSRKEYISENLNKIFFISDFYKIKSFVIFKLFFGGQINTTLYTLNLKDNKFTLFSSIISDSTTHYFSLGSAVHCADDKTIYTSLSASELINQRWKTISKPQQPLNSRLINYFESASNRNNPVIIELYPKSI